MKAMTISPEINRLIDQIREDKTHGASELARQAVIVLKVAAEKSQADSAERLFLHVQEAGNRLMSARPSMAPTYNAIRRLLDSISADASTDLYLLKSSIMRKADELVRTSIRASAQIAGHAADLISDKDVILTHSYSSTVAMALIEAGKKHHIRVIISRSGPGRTGEKTACELGSAGIPLVFIDDTALGLYVSQAHKVLVGADRICADGGLVNGIGTYLLALAAKKAEVPFCVLCETLKFDPRLKSTQVELEEKETAEVIGPGILYGETTVKNPYFDITPFEFISGIITEDGLVKQKDLFAYLEKLTAGHY